MSTMPEETPRDPAAAQQRAAQESAVQQSAAQHVVAQTTVDSASRADELARRVVAAGLAACVQTSEVRSVFAWDGAVQQEPEQMLAMKTTAAAVDGLRTLLEAEHPYDEPELVVLPIVDGSPSYLAWVAESVAPG